MLNADVLTFQEFAMRETLPLSRLHAAVLEFLQGRDDVVLFGAQAVNAYVSEPRMTQDVDLLSTRARELAEDLRVRLSEEFHIATRVREIKAGLGFRIYQVRTEGNRHLVDVRMVQELPPSEQIEKINVLAPLELILSKVTSLHGRKGKPKAGTDWRDLAMLLLRFPELKTKIRDRLIQQKADASLLATWAELESQDLQPEVDDDDLSF
jgi:hypothetical protein